MRVQESPPRPFLLAHTIAVPFAVGRAPLVVTRPRVAAADISDDALFAARSALRHAYAMRTTADTQVEQLKKLVDRLEAERRAGP
jgi:hypothetical protein